MIHVLDASRAVGVASSLVSDTQREPLDRQHRRRLRASSRVARPARARASLPASPTRAPTASRSTRRARRRRPRSPGFTHSATGRSRDLRASIDWTPFFRAWELAGNYPGDPRRRGGRRERAQPVRRCAGDARPDHRRALGDAARRRSACGAASARATTCWSSPATTGPALPFLRQQVKKREGRPNMCLADFIDPDGEDWIGGFAVGIHGLEPHLARFKAAERRLFGHPAEGARRPPRRELRRSAARRCPQPPVGLCRRASDQRGS